MARRRCVTRLTSAHCRMRRSSMAGSLSARSAACRVLDLGRLLHELRLRVGHLDPEELDAIIPAVKGAGLSSVGGRSADGGREAERGLGGAALETDRGADDVEGGEPEVAVDEAGSDEGVIEVPDVKAAERGAVVDRQEVRCVGIPCSRHARPHAFGDARRGGIDMHPVLDEEGGRLARGWLLDGVEHPHDRILDPLPGEARGLVSGEEGVLGR